MLILHRKLLKRNTPPSTGCSLCCGCRCSGKDPAALLLLLCAGSALPKLDQTVMHLQTMVEKKNIRWSAFNCAVTSEITGHFVTSCCWYRCAADVSTQFKACSTDAAAGQNPSMPGNFDPFGSRGAHRREPISPRWSILPSSIYCCLFEPDGEICTGSLPQRLLPVCFRRNRCRVELQGRSMQQQKAEAATILRAPWPICQAFF
jgi:hypothetical protein